MHFRTAASVAILACATSVAAEPKPYKIAMMPVLGMSLARRDTNGYQPEQSVCGEGATCSEACGAGYAECAAKDDSIHCFNPEAKQQCCQDNSGNSCDEGYYCTQDTSSETWCCPNSMDLAACAAAYNVDGGLKTPEVSTSEAPATSTTEAPTSSTEASTSTPEPEPETTSEVPVTYATPEPQPETSSETPATTSVFQPNTTIVYETPSAESSTFVPISSTSIWTGSNSTITSGAPAQPSESGPTTSAPPESGAGALALSPLLLIAAGLAALL
jgi:hypothetical protein